MDDNGTCIDPTPWEDLQIEEAMYEGTGEFAALDYYQDRTQHPVDSNHGWPDIIFEDEYPLEIQCQSCFTRFFLAKYESKWGPSWE